MIRVSMTDGSGDIEVIESYGRRLIEQGRAVYVGEVEEEGGGEEGSAAIDERTEIESGEIVDFAELLEDITALKALFEVLGPEMESLFSGRENLVALAGTGQAQKVISIGKEIDMTYTDQSSGTGGPYGYPYIVGDIRDATGADGVKYKRSLWMVPKLAGPYTIQFDGAATWVPVDLQAEPRAVLGWKYRGWIGDAYVSELSVLAGGRLPTNYSRIEKQQTTADGYSNLDPARGRWRDSCMRMWMNSEAVEEGWWKATDPKDPPPSEADLGRPGWASGIDASWRKVALKVLIGTPALTDGVWRMEYTEDTWFPPSIEMINVRMEAASSGEAAMEWYQDSEEPHDAGSTETREKTQIRAVGGAEAVTIWTRSQTEEAGKAWAILPNGTVGGKDAQEEIYPLPCFVIAGEPEAVWSQENAPEEGDDEWTDESIYRYYIDERGHLIQEKTEDVETEGSLEGEGRFTIRGE